MLNFDLGQTFFIDKQSVENSDVAFVTSIELYFYRKPTQNQTVTGINNPGVSVYVCPTKTDGSPDPSIIHQEYGTRVEYSNIIVSTSGASSTALGRAASRFAVVNWACKRSISAFLAAICS